MRSIKITIYVDVPDTTDYGHLRPLNNSHIAEALEPEVRHTLALLGGSLEGFAIHPDTGPTELAEDLPPGESRHGGVPPGVPGPGTREPTKYPAGREYPVYVARVHVQYAVTDTRDSIPFHAESDADARAVGQQLLMVTNAHHQRPDKTRVQVLELVIGFWDGACFSTGADRMVYDSGEVSDG